MDNFLQIRTLLKFNSLGDFYFIQIFKRKKDNPSMDKHEKLIKSYSVFSLQEYDKAMADVYTICNLNNARAYIRLNKRNSRNTALHMIKYLSESILSGQTNSLHKCYDSIVGQYHTDDSKTWLIDVDGDINLANDVINYLHDLTALDETRILFRTSIPTINGYHIICQPFDTREFKTKFPGIDIHKDNPTLLYYEPILKES